MATTTQQLMANKMATGTTLMNTGSSPYILATPVAGAQPLGIQAPTGATNVGNSLMSTASGTSLQSTAPKSTILSTAPATSIQSTAPASSLQKTASGTAINNTANSPYVLETAVAGAKPLGQPANPAVSNPAYGANNAGVVSSSGQVVAPTNNSSSNQAYGAGGTGIVNPTTGKVGQPPQVNMAGITNSSTNGSTDNAASLNVSNPAYGASGNGVVDSSGKVVTTTTGGTDITPQSALENLVNSLKMSDTEKTAQENLNNAMNAKAKGLQNIKNQTIPMEYLTGQANTLEQGSQAGITNAQNKLALAQTERGLQSTAAQAELGFETTKMQSDNALTTAGYVPANATNTQGVDPSRIITSATGTQFIKPLTTATSPTGTLYSYNPVTNSVQNLQQFGKLLTGDMVTTLGASYLKSGQATTVEQANNMATKYYQDNGYSWPNGNTTPAATTNANDPSTYGITQQQADSMLNDITKNPSLLDTYAPLSTKSGLRSYLINQMASNNTSLTNAGIVNSANAGAYADQLKKFATYQQADDNIKGNVANIQPLINLLNTNPQFANSKINAAKIALGDANAKALQAGIDIISNDLTTLFSKGNVTESVRSEATSLIDPGITAGQFVKTWDLLQKDIQNNKDSFQNTMKGLLAGNTGGNNFGTGTRTNNTSNIGDQSDQAFNW